VNKKRTRGTQRKNKRRRQRTRARKQKKGATGNKNRGRTSQETGDEQAKNRRKIEKKGRT
jgi:hypothetical protein